MAASVVAGSAASDDRHRARFPLAIGQRAPGTFETPEEAESFLVAMREERWPH